jgi:hypothetical protein
MREVLRETRIYLNNNYIRKKNMILLMRKKKKHQHRSNQHQTKNEMERPQPAEGEYVTRSRRISIPPDRLEYVAFESVMKKYDYQDEYKWYEADLLAFKVSSDPDTMYHHQAMRQLDRKKFLKAMQDECTAHSSTGEISKYRARMNVNGKEQIPGVHYEETYAPVVG